jgi:ABC transport system ATP-binding/permease protein
MSSLRVRIAGQEIVADGSRPLVIGRDDGADIVSASDEVSRRHAVLRLDPQAGWVLEDAASKNGTYQDGQRVARVVIDRPVVVTLGDPGVGETLSFEPVVDRARPGGPAAEPALGSLSVGHMASVRQAPAGLVRIGRAPDNDLVLDDFLVSRHHAELRPDDDGFSIVDLGSHNGTYIDGRRVASDHLTRGSLVSIGLHHLRLVGTVLEEYVDTGEIDFAASGLSVMTAKGQTLLDGVSFTLGPNSLLAVLGPTGAGKSTLVKALTGFVPADHGTVLYNGRDLYAAYQELRRRIGYVPQDDILHPELTVRQALEYAAQLRLPPDLTDVERSRRVADVMGELGLGQRADLAIHRLSGGQRKRTNVALELLAQPSLLFLDEPTSGLDPGYEKTVMELLRALADSGRTVIVVTHSVESLDLCDRLLFLAPGGVPAYFGSPGSATAHFGVRDYADVFRRLENEDVPWAQFASGPDTRPTVQSPAGAPPPPPARATGPAPAQPGWGGQVATLSRRYLSIIVADRRALAILLLQAPLIGLLFLTTTKPDGFAMKGLVNARAATLVGDIILAATFVGLGNSIREIVKELPVYRRERAVGLSISAYLTSKFVVLGAITVAQAAVVVLITTARAGGLADSATAVGSARAEIVVAAAMTGLAAVGLGLLVSTLVSSADKAMVLLPLLLIGSYIFAAPNLDVAKTPTVKYGSMAIASKWGFAAMGSSARFYTLLNRPECEGGPGAETADSNALKTLQSTQLGATVPDCNSSFRHTASAWYQDIGAMVGLTALELVVAGLLLRRQDPTRVRRPLSRPAAG